jgi:hypothetical protein
MSDAHGPVSLLSLSLPLLGCLAHEHVHRRRVLVHRCFQQLFLGGGGQGVLLRTSPSSQAYNILFHGQRVAAVIVGARIAARLAVASTMVVLRVAEGMGAGEEGGGVVWDEGSGVRGVG